MKAWDDFLFNVRQDVGEAVYKKWLEPLRVIRFDAANLFLEASDQFQAVWFEEHIRPRARQELVNNNGRPVKIHLQIQRAPLPFRPVRRRTVLPDQPKPPTFALQFDELDPDAQFEQFIPSKSNRMAGLLLQEMVHYLSQKPLQQFTKEEMKSYNPIYIHGPSGSGKTHLLMAAARALTEAGIKTIYTRAETFTAHVVNAIRAGEMSLFRQTYRSTEVLIVDDVHDFSRKGATQEELFHTFNALHLSEKTLIMSSYYPPQELELIEPRLISRFEWGIVMPIGLLDKEQMAAMLHQRSLNRNFPLNGKVEKFLLEQFGRHPKHLVKALDALILRVHMSDNKGSSDSLTENDARHLLADLIKEQEALHLTPDKILAAVSEHYAIPQGDILGKSQKRETSLPRQISMYLCREQLNLPFMKIGLLFDRDHSTVMSSIKRIQKDHEQGTLEVSQALNSIIGKLHSH